MAHPRRRFAGGAKRLTIWIGPADQAYVGVATGGATMVALSPEFGEATTLVRTRGHTSVQPGSFAADLNIVGAVGMGVVSLEASVVGISALPLPFDDANWGGWMVWRSFSLHFDVQSAAGFDVNSALEFEVDSKAMRKVGSNEVFVIVAQSQVGAFDISTPWRYLVKLS